MAELFLPFLYPWALLGLLSVIPLIILYMLLPKPFKVEIPSTMFIKKVEESKKKVYASITKIIKDPLFFIQLFVLILLALAAAAPYILTWDSLSDKDTVIVIDVSASMQAPGRLDKAIKDAENYLSRTNSVILASEKPLIAAEKVNAGEAKKVLQEIEAKAITADISSAMYAASGILSEKGGNMIVFSDFSSWEGASPLETKKMLESGINIQFVGQTNFPGNNVGIVNGYPEYSNGKYNYKFVVRNYGPAKTVSAKAQTSFEGKNTESASIRLNLPANSTEQFVFEDIPRGITTIVLEGKDSVEMDNFAYVSVPEKFAANALYITDSAQSPPSMIALSLISELNLKKESTVPADMSSYKFIVINPKRDLTGEETGYIENYTRNGGNAIFIAGDYLVSENRDLNISKMIPLRFTEKVTEEKGVNVYDYGKTTLTEGLNFSEIYLRTFIKAEKRTIQGDYLVQTRDGNPIVAYFNYKDGTAIYIGLNDLNDLENEDEWNNFATTPYFPIFWTRLASLAGDIGTLQDINLKAGGTRPLGVKTVIETPEGNITTDSLTYDTAGFYTVNGKKIAVNLYNDKESNVYLSGENIVSDSKSNTLLQEQYEVKKILVPYLIIIAILFIIIELYILNKRGEL
ncbi:MAG: hypothetical protein GX362_05710 [Methanosarcinaceae archaeon]|mgnify:CR=1 FL=1|nr:hypothetical protein [Methanosarcinaceae archaeon]